MKPAQQTLLFTVAVWGKDYIETFLDLALPSFLAPGNIPACASLLAIKFQVITRPEDLHLFENRPVMTALAAHAEISIEPRLEPEYFGGNRYSVMSIANRFAIEESLERGAILSILPPDCIIADGSLSFGIKRILDGHQAIMVCGPKGLLEAIAPTLSAAPYASDDRTRISISSQDLVSLQVKNPHPMAQILYWRRNPFSGFPSCIYWAAGQDSMLARYFHLHPLFVDMSAASGEARRCGTQDSGLLLLAQIPLEKTFVATRSQDICVIELSRLAFDTMASKPVEVPDKTQHIIDWAMDGGACRLHREQFRRYAFMQQGRETVDWAAVTADADRDMGGLFEGLARLDREEERQLQAIESQKKRAERLAKLQKMALMPRSLASRIKRLPRRIIKIARQHVREH